MHKKLLLNIRIAITIYQTEVVTRKHKQNTTLYYDRYKKKQ